MPREKSCGAVVFREEEGEPRYLLLHYGSGHWGFPKGNVEKGEKELETAEREVREETGIEDLEFIDPFRHRISYFYRRKGSNIYKEVVYFLARTNTRGVKLSYEHLGYQWHSFPESMRRLRFQNTRELLRKAHSFLEENSEAWKGSKQGKTKEARKDSLDPSSLENPSFLCCLTAQANRV